MATSVNPATVLQPAPSTGSRANTIEDLSADDFLKFLITELQQQDPLDPVKNQDLLNQVNTIRDIASTTKLNETLDSVLMGQNLSTAGGLIGKTVKALTDKGDEVNGKVTSVSVATDSTDKTKRDISIHVGDKTVRLTNIREIVP
jgi:flagellar basal-body rod modification protein FlgD